MPFLGEQELLSGLYTLKHTCILYKHLNGTLNKTKRLM